MTSPPSSATPSLNRHTLAQWPVEAAELARAWRLLYDTQAPRLPWSQRWLALSSLFPARPSAWLLALDARLSALDQQVRRLGLVLNEAAFAAAARAPLLLQEDAYSFPADTRW
ncbi:MAG: hypothetical protein KatS3mg122_1838 [Caldimonas sp.]|uniref:hypothetical protein n=1 Tax=Caldimonas taiwanensis TaxID=307483 RepID=UPI0012FCC352|nr:hypothetical protein [Caldimonas taiwanensis]GIX24607.1 MAG: hypothetical protein KatS3mg122_1838 [Caldimonas sp.]